MNLRGTCIVPLYKGKGNMCECSRGCMDQVFAVRRVCEKHLVNGIYLFWAFLDLDSCDTIDRHGMCKMQRVYGV